MFTIIPEEGMTEILNIVQGVLGDTMPFALSIIGVLLGLYILGGLFPKNQ
jgi:hypothetical protein